MSLHNTGRIFICTSLDRNAKLDGIAVIQLRGSLSGNSVSIVKGPVKRADILDEYFLKVKIGLEKKCQGLRIHQEEK